MGQTGILQDPEGVKIHKHFLVALRKVEEEIEKRNKNLGERAFPYTLLIPSNPSTDVLPGARPSARSVNYPR